MNAEIDRCTGVTRRLLLLSRLSLQQAQIVSVNRALSDTLQLLDFDAQSHVIEQQLELAVDDLRVPVSYTHLDVYKRQG